MAVFDDQGSAVDILRVIMKDDLFIDFQIHGRGMSYNLLYC